MTSRTTLKITALALAAIVAGPAVQAASLTQVGTDRGGILINLSGHELAAPFAQTAQTHNGGFINVGTDRGGVVRPVNGTIVDTPFASAFGEKTDTRHTNLGTDRGGVVFLVK